jgi:hypothetical protein
MAAATGRRSLLLRLPAPAVGYDRPPSADAGRGSRGADRGRRLRVQAKRHWVGAGAGVYECRRPDASGQRAGGRVAAGAGRGRGRGRAAGPSSTGAELASRERRKGKCRGRLSFFFPLSRAWRRRRRQQERRRGAPYFSGQLRLCSRSGDGQGREKDKPKEKTKTVVVSLSPRRRKTHGQTSRRPFCTRQRDGFLVDYRRQWLRPPAM